MTRANHRILTPFFLLTALFILAACTINDNTIELNEENFPGIWRTTCFVENAGNWQSVEDYAAMYVTDDGNLFLLLTHSRTLTPMDWPGDQRYRQFEGIEITSASNGLHVDILFSNTNQNGTFYRQRSHVLYKHANEVPYGWTNAHRQEIKEAHLRIHHEISHFAQQFADALQLPLYPYNIDEWRQRTLSRHIHPFQFPFIMDDVVIEIALGRTPPMITQPQRHIHVPGRGPTLVLTVQALQLNREARTANFY